MKHFGCIVRNPIKLTRENYAQLTDSNRIKTLVAKQVGLLGQTCDEIINDYWQLYGKDALATIQPAIESYFNTQDKVNSNKESADKLIEYVKKQELKQYIYFKLWDNFGEEAAKQADIEDYMTNKIFEPFRENIGYNMFSDTLQTKVNLPYALSYIKPRTLSFYERVYGEVNKYNGINTDILKSCIVDTDNRCRVYGKQYSEYLRNIALINFDYNMKYFNSLSTEEFNNEVEAFKKEHPDFIEVESLQDYKQPGIYVIILDEYKQVYIGITRSKNGIKGRIQQHWTTHKKLDRLMFGGVETSILSIDSFEHLDTTRILVSPRSNFRDPVLNVDGTTKKIPNPINPFKECTLYIGDEYIESEEWKLVNSAFSDKFILNRCAGGGHSLLDAIATRRNHDSE